MTLFWGLCTRIAQCHHQRERRNQRHRATGLWKRAEITGDIVQGKLRLPRRRRTAGRWLATLSGFGEAGAIGHGSLLYRATNRICLGRGDGGTPLGRQQSICPCHKLGNGFGRGLNDNRRCGLKGQQRRGQHIN